ncbi:hypothetical protein D1007_38166 [Hordeum vulgare]|nr:hypothetical protein D1007_38166 [Hordeum vulgare]
MLSTQELVGAAAGAPWRTRCDGVTDTSRSNGATPASPYGMASPSSASDPNPTAPCCPCEVQGAALSPTSALVGGIHVRRPLPRVPRSAPPAARRQIGRPLRLATRGRPLLLAPPGEARAPCSARTPCSKPCSLGWAEIEQEQGN